jgi:hypothetical protein
LGGRGCRRRDGTSGGTVARSERIGGIWPGSRGQRYLGACIRGPDDSLLVTLKLFVSFLPLLDIGNGCRQSSLVTDVLQFQAGRPLDALQRCSNVDLNRLAGRFELRPALEIRFAFLWPPKLMIRHPPKVEATWITASTVDGHCQQVKSLLVIPREVGVNALAIQFGQKRVLSSGGRDRKSQRH